MHTATTEWGPLGLYTELVGKGYEGAHRGKGKFPSMIPRNSLEGMLAILYVL